MALSAASVKEGKRASCSLRCTNATSSNINTEGARAQSPAFCTRRWIWRQGEYSKATEASTNLFFPIDGFRGANEARILQARAELAMALTDLTGAIVREGWVDNENRSMAID